MSNESCIAMILAGGQGARLGALTHTVAKPAVPFGAHYRIIDFALTNCTYSGIRTVGILTQYRPFLLHTYIGNGSAWDLDSGMGGVFILPPYLKSEGGSWYRGTANAVYQNAGFIERFSPREVLILSGDHIYKMHYGKMAARKRATGASGIISVIRVPLSEASRFGIMETDADGRVTAFCEKPKTPKSNLASMGIYLFDWALLKKYLAADEADPTSQNDFGKNIIPKMLAAGESLYAYPFDGYWKDVGTIGAYWEANMDVLSAPPRFDLYDADWRIRSGRKNGAPHYVAPGAALTESIAAEDCRIYGTVEKSVLFPGVTVEKNAYIRQSVVLSDVRIMSGAVIQNAVIGPGRIVRDITFDGKAGGILYEENL